ncbi:MAG: hypothetical protein K0Q68_3165 [Moraxellaceae bacterium]|jgi:hypothetical protein|nr:hypothetical protein [Moraxellaceae bacterium]
MYEDDDTLREEAEWFGKTGLPEDIERHLPYYVRMEFGESVLDEDSVKASNFIYHGCHQTKDGVTHYWRIEYEPQEQWATITVSDADNYNFNWGGTDLAPPDHAA